MAVTAMLGGLLVGANAVPAHALNAASCTGVADFAGGAGTSGSPYQVSNAQELLNATACGAAVYLLQTQDIDLATETWTPGAMDAHYLGNDMTISNLNLNTGGGFGGLFTWMDGTVQDLVLSNFAVASAGRSGALVGYAGLSSASMSIKNVRVVGGTVVGTSSTGGIAGTFLKGAILDSTSSAAVTATGGSAAGGLVGELATGATASIRGSSASGTVTGVPAGGLVGFMGAGTIAGSSATGTVAGATNSSSTLGGLVADLRNGTISDSYATGTVRGATPGDTSGGTSRGGLVGTTQLGTATISRSYSTASVWGSRYVAGLVGNLGTGFTVEDSYAAGDVHGAPASPGDASGLAATTTAGTILTSYTRGTIAADTAYGVGTAGLTADPTKVFWDSTVSGATAAGAGTGNTTAVMQTPATYTAANWDSTDVWLLAAGEYPVLQHPVPAVPATQAYAGAVSHAITLTNNAVGTGTNARLTVRGYSLTGTVAALAQYSVTANTCTDGAVVNPSATCAVTVASTGTNPIGARLNVYTNAGVVSTDLLTLPDAPTGVTATAGDAQATVSWTPPANDGGATIVDYTVTANPGGQTCSVTSVAPATPATSCTVIGLANGTPVTFTVTATTAAGTGPASTASTAVTPVASGGGGGGGGGGSTSGGSTGTSTATASTPAATPVPAPAASPQGPLGPIALAGGAGSGVVDGGLVQGGSVLTVGGEPVAMNVTPNRDLDPRGLDITAPGFTMYIEGRGDINDPLGLTPKSALVLQSEQGAQTRVKKVRPVAVIRGTGFEPGSEVKVWMLPGQYVGTIAVDARGAFSGRVDVPTLLATGGHTLQANGYTTDGVVRSVSLGIDVIARQLGAGRSMADSYFDAGSATLTPKAKGVLTRLVAKVPATATGLEVRITGFVQPTRFTGNDKALSKARAESVARFLKAKGLHGHYVVSGKGRAQQSGPVARRVVSSVAYWK